MGYKPTSFCVIFQFLTMFNTICGTGAVGAEAASRYGFGSDQNMWLLAAPAPKHCKKVMSTGNELSFNTSTTFAGVDENLLIWTLVEKINI
jgi:hypothetical protein